MYIRGIQLGSVDGWTTDSLTPAPRDLRIENEENPEDAVRCVLRNEVMVHIWIYESVLIRQPTIDGIATTTVNTYLTKSVQDTHLGDFLDGSYFFGIRHGIGLFWLLKKLNKFDSRATMGILYRSHRRVLEVNTSNEKRTRTTVGCIHPWYDIHHARCTTLLHRSAAQRFVSLLVDFFSLSMRF